MQQRDEATRWRRLGSPGGIDEAWFRRVLPPKIVDSLRKVEDAQSRASEIMDWMERADSAYRGAVDAFSGLTEGSFLHLRPPAEVRQHGLSQASSTHPPPIACLRMLLAHSYAGGDAAEVLDQTGRARVASSVLSQSLSTYLSHLKTICGFCALLQVEPVPASQLAVQRYAAFINHPVTLRGHLAAWKLWHTVTGHAWKRDPWVWAAHKGILKHRPSMGRQRFALRRHLTIKLATDWIAKKRYRFAFTAAFGYFYMSRIPSELFCQFKRGLLVCRPKVIEYCPIRRKGQSHCQISVADVAAEHSLFCARTRGNHHCRRLVAKACKLLLAEMEGRCLQSTITRRPQTARNSGC